MAATIEIHEMSALATGTDKTAGTVRFKDADDATVDTNNPLVIPGSGDVYSYTKKVRAYMEDAPSTKVENLRWYPDAANGFGTGISVKAKNIGTTWGANYKTAMSGGASLWTYSSGSPLDGDGVDTSPFLPAKLDSYIGDLIELQMTVHDDAAQGALTPETLTLAYDEI